MKIIMSLEVPEISKKMIQEYFNASGFDADLITSRGNLVFSSGMDTTKKERLCADLISHMVKDRIKIQPSQLNLFEA